MKVIPAAMTASQIPRSLKGIHNGMIDHSTRQSNLNNLALSRYVSVGLFHREGIPHQHEAKIEPGGPTERTATDCIFNSLTARWIRMQSLPFAIRSSEIFECVIVHFHDCHSTTPIPFSRR